MMPQFLRASCFALPLSREKAQHKRDIKIFYHYQEEFSINFHIYIHKKSTRVRFLSADASFCKRQAKKQSLVLVKKVAGEALQNSKIPRQHSFKGTTILLQLHVSIQQSGERLLYRSPLFVLILSAVYPFAAGWISDIPAASGSPPNAQLRLHVCTHSNPQNTQIAFFLFSLDDAPLME
mgnify:CR=1 FL=1